METVVVTVTSLGMLTVGLMARFALVPLLLALISMPIVAVIMSVEATWRTWISGRAIPGWHVATIERSA